MRLTILLVNAELMSAVYVNSIPEAAKEESAIEYGYVSFDRFQGTSVCSTVMIELINKPCKA